MSDTLFLENGKYYYNVDADKGYGLYAGIGLKSAKHYMYNNYNDKGNNYDREFNEENEEYNPWKILINGANEEFDSVI